MKHESTLLSDFDIVIDDSLLTSEPDLSAANNIEQITKIALAIGKQLRNNCTEEKDKHQTGKQLFKYSYQPMWGHNLSFKGVLSGGQVSSDRPKRVAHAKKSRKKGDKKKGKNKLNDINNKATSPVFFLTDTSKKTRTQRSKQGCWTCRLRHKACPEDGNPCGTCTRLGLHCDVSRQRPSYMVDAKHTMKRLKEIRGVTDSIRKQHRKGWKEFKKM